MVGESGAFGVSRIVAGAMRRAVAEEEHPTGLDLDCLGFGFVREAADVMIAVPVALVREEGVEGVGDHAHGSVGNRRIVDCDPHRGAAERLGDFEVGIVLVPRGAHSRLSGLQENLVQMKRDFRTD